MLLTGVASAASLFLAVFVYLQGRDRPLNQVLALFSLTISLWTFGQLMGGFGGEKEMVLFWTRLNVAAAVLLPPLYLNFILLMTGRYRQEKWLLAIDYFFALILLGLLATPLFVKDVAPVGDYAFYPQAGPVYAPFAFYLVITFLYAFFRLFRESGRGEVERRNQLLFVIIASLIGFGGGLTAFLPVWGITAVPVLSNYALPLYVLITFYAIVKHRLFDITFVVRESLVYSALTLIFTGFYALAILAANYWVDQLGHLDRLWTVLLVIFVSVLIFQPLRDRVQKVVDRFFFQGEFRYRAAVDRLSRENRDLLRGLLRADKLAALGTLAAGMAHEIKNPLAAIKGMTQALPDNLSDRDFIADYSDLVPRQLDRINQIVEKLLRAGKTVSGEKRELDLNKLVEEVVLFNENLCRKHGIEVESRSSPLPKIFGDPEQLHQAFLNIILNAIQAMPAGGSLSVKSALQDDRTICVVVGDTGGGIPADKLENIFDPFFTLKENGTGLGLFTTYRIIQEHEGSIEVESSLEKGTRFTICLPIRPKRSA